MGQAIGRLATDAGWHLLYHDACIDEAILPQVKAVSEDAELVDREDLCRRADIVILAIPFSTSCGLDYSLLDGKIVIDPMNYWAEYDGIVPELVGYEGTTSQIVWDRNPKMRLVKTLNHQAWRDLESDARSSSVAKRRAFAVCSDDTCAQQAVAELIDDMGFDPVPVPFSYAKSLEMGGPIFGRHLDVEGMKKALQII